MPRARNVKPAFFLHEVLAGLAAWVRLLFIGLWTLADRAGRLQDRPKRIGVQVFPYEPGLSIEDGLRELAQHGFIHRYTVAGEQFIQIANWAKHQKPHHQEPESVLPVPPRSNSVADATDFGPTSEALRTDTEPIRLQPSTFNLQPATGNRQPDQPHSIGEPTDAHDQPAANWSLEDPFDWYVKLWPGGIPDDCWRTFAEKVNTHEKLSALRANAPLWAATRKYRDGFSDAKAFIRSGVWENPPKAALLDGGQAKADERARADEELYGRLEKKMEGIG